MRFSTFSVLVLATTVSAINYLGFNSGSKKDDLSAKFKSDFVAEFKTAQNLENAPGDFSAVRLYTCIQAYSKDDPIEAFAAAVETKTHIFLGIWASGTDSIEAEISALRKAIAMFGSAFTDLVIAAAVGNEDLYRDSVTGIKNKSGTGASPQTIINFIKTFRSAFAGTALAQKPCGHVDTQDAWTNVTVKPVIDEVDFIGLNEFPYYEDAKGNSIQNSGSLFDHAYNSVVSVAGDTPIMVTETGWPFIGPSWDEAVPSVDNAQYYWQEVGCRRLFGKVTTFWYTLQDSNADNKMKFAITDKLSTKPRFNLTCPKTFDTPTAVSSSVSLPSSTSSSAPAAGKLAADNSAAVKPATDNSAAVKPAAGNSAAGNSTAGTRPPINNSGSLESVPSTTKPTANSTIQGGSSPPDSAVAASGASSLQISAGFYSVLALCGGLFILL